MYSPVNINNNVRMGVNPKKHIIYGTRKIKSIKETKKYYSSKSSQSLDISI